MKFNIINSNGISDYVMIEETVKDQNTEIMPTAAKEMIGSCSLNRMEVPKMMVTKDDGEAVTLA